MAPEDTEVQRLKIMLLYLADASQGGCEKFDLN